MMDMIDPLAGEVALGALPEEERKNYYDLVREVSPTEEPPLKVPTFLDPKRSLYEAQELIFGYIEKDKQIVPANSTSPQKNLANQRLDVTLARFHVERYPGSSRHVIQINFSVNHLVNLADAPADSPLSTESILYGYVVNAVDQQAVPLLGTAVFRGLNIQNELSMRINTLNLVDPVEENILNALQSDVMKSGLTLLATTNPIFPMVTELVQGATKLFLTRNRNKTIQQATLGFLINAARGDPKLREGSYVLIQADSDRCRLEDYYWNTERGRVERKDLQEELAYNYMVLSVKKSLS